MAEDTKADDKKKETEKKEEKPKAPELGSGKTNESDWVFYLQQLLNFKYQMQVVEENGQWDSTTANAVAHFREYYGLGDGDKVDKKTWKELGHEDETSTSGTASGTTADGQVEEVNKEVSLIEADNSDQTWASAIATVLSSKGGNHTVANVCEQAGHTERLGFSEIQMFAQDKFHLVPLDVRAKVPASWSAVLKSNGPVLSRTSDDYHQVVVCGIKSNDSKVEVNVVDPVSKQSQWMELEAGFLSTYGLNPEAEIKVFGVG